MGSAEPHIQSFHFGIECISGMVVSGPARRDAKPLPLRRGWTFPRGARLPSCWAVEQLWLFNHRLKEALSFSVVVGREIRQLSACLGTKPSTQLPPTLVTPQCLQDSPGRWMGMLEHGHTHIRAYAPFHTHAHMYMHTHPPYPVLLPNVALRAPGKY